MNPSDIRIEECLKILGISMLGDWDVLVFLYRHRASLTSAEQIARLLGYPSKTVADALNRLESHKMLERSRSSQGARLYEFVFPEAHLAPESCFRWMLGFSETRPGRLQLIKHLRHGVGLNIQTKGTTK